jgi:hypothetical protein
VGWNVPARNPGFTGRAALLTAVREALASGDLAVVQVLRGMGGVGKTQLAIEYAHRFADSYDVIWWISAETASLIGAQFAALGVDLGCADARLPMDAMRRLVLAELRERTSWLLIFDNAERAEDIADWLPGGTGHVLITSRAPGWDEIAVSVAIDVLDRAESVALLRGRVRQLSEADADLAAAALGDLPLAVAQAAGYMAETGLTCGEYTDLLRRRAAEILAEGRPSSYPRSLTAVTELTFGRLREESPTAAELAEICAFLAPEPIPVAWFTQAAPVLRPPLSECAADPLAWRRVLAALGRSSLLRVDGDVLVMHRLTQAVIRGYRSNSHLGAGQELAGRLLLANIPGDAAQPAKWPAWAALLPHVRALDPAASQSTELRATAQRCAWYLVKRGDADGAYELARNLHERSREQLGEQHPDTIRSEVIIAQALRDLERFYEAHLIDERVLAWRRETLGMDDPETLSSAGNLAVDLAEMLDTEAAQELNKDTLARRSRVLGESHPDTLTTASNLAVNLAQLSMGAVVTGLGIGEIYIEELDVPPPTSAAARRSQLRSALELSRETLGRRRQVLGEDHPDTLMSASNVACLLAQLGRRTDARRLDEDTLARRRRVLGDDHPDTLKSACNLVSDLEDLGHYDTARELDRATQDRFERRGDDPLTVSRTEVGHLTPSKARSLLSWGRGNSGK